MTFYVIIPDEIQEVLRKWKKSAPKLFKKFEKLHAELMDHPRTGTGHPEPLKGGGGVTYSRHITAHDRIIYDIEDEKITVTVLEVEGHYNDK